VRAQVGYVATLQRGVTVLGRLVELEEGMEEGIVQLAEKEAIGKNPRVESSVL
jgi:hypothetical protein